MEPSATGAAQLVKIYGMRLKHLALRYFYTTDNFELISKGLQKVLDSEHWLSRDLLMLIRSLQAAGDALRKGKINGTQCLLTLREQEIRIMIGAGNRTRTRPLPISCSSVQRA